MSIERAGDRLLDVKEAAAMLSVRRPTARMIDNSPPQPRPRPDVRRPTARVQSEVVPLYLYAEDLAAVTPWSVDAIEKMVRRNVLKRGIHYFQPFGQRGRLIFKWRAVVEFIEGTTHNDGANMVEPEATVESKTRRTTGHNMDVENAKAELQRLLD